ncbi:hypothetical protein VA602_18165 [Pseudomonas sp. MH2]|uniref:Pyocin activator protein PrtN n=1 Tax=Pseudomonas machongensis TaxID=3110229 RepID=A0ABU5VLF0_9PSED|nr:hypothetical protein [Pseudomonas sp. MH2]MEA5673250.1 hypothetical protein [Pseudomonas sp. MH2]
MKWEQQILPRILRWRSAPGYLGMCKAEFNKTVRPFVNEFPIGAQGVGFDRYELDEWVDSYIAENAIEKGNNRAGLPASARKRAEENRTEQSKSEFKQALDLVRRKR